MADPDVMLPDRPLYFMDANQVHGQVFTGKVFGLIKKTAFSMQFWSGTWA